MKINEDLAVREKIYALLNNNNSLTLATITNKLSQSNESSAESWAADLFYASDENFVLYFISSQESRHSQDIENNSKVAATISQNQTDWFTIKGLQLSGHAKLIKDKQAHQKALALYLNKFNQLQAICHQPSNSSEEKIKQRILSSSFYCIEPQWIRIIENSQDFAYKKEWRLN